MKNTVPWFSPQVGDDEQKNIKRVIKLNYPNQGLFTKQFENKISKLLKIKYVVAVPSGTVAIYLALKAIGVKINDKVVVPNITFMATANAVTMVGAKVILVDVDKNNLGICMVSLKKIIIKNKIKAIIPVHVSGRASNILDVIKLAKKNKINVIEDAAEAFYSKNTSFLGTLGDLGCFSFSPNKIITTGQGGAVVTNNKKNYLNLLKLRDQGRIGKVTGGGEDNIVSIGYNFKFTNILSSIGIAQLSKLKKRKKNLIKNYLIYKKNLPLTKSFKLFEFDLKKGELPLWTDVYVLNRDKLISKLKKKGIECRKFWTPLNLHPYYKKSFKYFPNSKFYYKKLLWLPSGFNMSKRIIQNVCKEIQNNLQ
jgi:perosamine synthetase